MSPEPAPTPNPVSGGAAVVPPRGPRLRGDGDEGVTTVFVGLLLTAMLAMGAIVLDGGRSYTLRRSMQNAADAAAMAGASALDDARFDGAADGAVQEAVEAEVAAHGGDRFTCALTDWSGTVTYAEDCGANSVYIYKNAASGVRVRVSDTESMFLGPIVDQRTTTVNTTATASIQAVNVMGTAPFIICGKAADARSGGDAYDFLTAANTLDVAAVVGAGYQTGGSQRFDIQGPHVPECGAGASFDGKVHLESTSIVPGVACPGFDPTHPPAIAPVGCEWVKGENGNAGLNNPNEIIAIATTTPCTAALLEDTGAECDTFLPVADYGVGNGNSTIYFHVAAWIPVRIRVEHGNPRYTGSINLDAAQVTGGPSLGGNVSAGMTRAVKLVD